MANIVVNLTFQLIADKIENVLSSYPNRFYQKAFSLPDLRQELTVYVLNRFPSSFIAIEEGQQSAIRYNPLYQLLEKRLPIESVIDEGIHDLIHNKIIRT